MYEGYLALGGNEIANAERVASYVRNNAPSIPLKACVEADGLGVVLGDGVYESPLVDDAPWVDELDPATQNFYGFYPLALDGAEDDTREADVVESIVDGGTVGSMRRGTRPMRMRGLLVGADDLAVDAGMSWLKSALSPAPCADHGGTCGGATACMFAARPEFTDCWYDLGIRAADIPVSPVSAESPFELRHYDTAQILSQYNMGISDGFVMEWGAEAADYLLEKRGPRISRRSNFVPNPRARLNLTGWLYGGRALSRVTVGAIDDGSYMRFAGADVVVNGSFLSVVAGTVALRQNLNLNPMFVGNASWTLPATIGGVWAGDGVMDITTAPTGSLLPYEAAVVPVRPDAEVTIQRTFSVPVGYPAFELRLGAVPYNAANQSQGATYNTEGYVTIQPGETRTLTVTATMPWNGVGIRSIPYLRTTTSVPVGSRLVMSKAIIEQVGYARPFFYGGTPDANGWDFGWAGAANASISTAKAAISLEVARTNLALSPTPVGTAGWNTNNGAITSAVTDSVTVRRTGSTSKRGDQATPGSTQTLLSLYNVGAINSAANGNPAVVPGQTYDLSLYAMSTETNSTHAFRYEWFDAAGTLIGVAVVGPSVAITTPNVWQRFSVKTAVAPAGAAFIRVTSNMVTNNAASTVTAASHGWVTDLLVEATTATGTTRPFFDGGLLQLNEMVSNWVSTAGASASQLRGARLVSTAGGNAAVFQSQKWANTGTNSLRTVANLATDNNSFAYVNGDTNAITSGLLVPGATYRLRLTGRIETAQANPSGSARGILLVTSAGNQSGPQFPNVAGAYPLDWTFTVPAGATSATLRLYNGGFAGDSDVFWDDVSLVPVTIPASVRTPDLPGIFGPVTVGLDVRGTVGTTVTASVVTVLGNAVIATAFLPVTADWQRFYVEAPFGRSVYIALESTADFEFSRVQMEAGELELPYFDGAGFAAFSLFGKDQPASEYAVAWTGAADNSPSTMTWISPPSVFDGTPAPAGRQYMPLEEVCETEWTAYLRALAGASGSGTYEQQRRLPIPVEVQTEKFERNFHDVSVIKGPTLIRKVPVSNGAIWDVEFFMQAGTPFAFGPTDELLDSEPMELLPRMPFTDVACPLPDSSPILDPDCPPLPAAPRPPAVPNVCIANPSVWQRFSMTIPSEKISGWSKMLPTIKLTTGPQDVRQVRVRFTPNPFRFPIEATGTRVNLATNPAFSKPSGATQDMVGWSVFGTPAPAAAAVVATTSAAALPASVNWALRARTVAATPVVGNFGIRAGAAGQNLVVAGTHIDASLYAFSSPSLGAKMQLRFMNAANAQVGALVDGPTKALLGLSSGAYQRFEMTNVLVPATAVRVEVTLSNSVAYPSGASLYATALMIETRNPDDTTPIKPFFHGNSPSENGVTFGWSTTPNIGTSYGQYSAIDPCGWCAEFILSYLPAYAEMTIDGLTQKAWASVRGKPDRPASGLLYGTDGVPMTWAELSCGIDYVMTVDVPLADVSNVSVSLALTRQE